MSCSKNNALFWVLLGPCHIILWCSVAVIFRMKRQLCSSRLSAGTCFGIAWTLEHVQHDVELVRTRFIIRNGRCSEIGPSFHPCYSSGLAFGMLALTFASSALFRMFCEKTGHGGTTQVATIMPTRS